MRRTVLLVEDQALMASLLSDALTSAGFDVCCAAGVAPALHALEDFDPDAAVLDIDLGPGATGFDLGSVLYRTRPGIALLFLTDKPEIALHHLHEHDLPPNAGFLLKGRVADAQALVDALEAVLADRPDLARHSVEAPSVLGLSPAQLDLLRDIAAGLTNRAIAERHNVSDSTIERWMAALFKHLQLCGGSGHNPRVEAARMYIGACGMPAAQ